MIETRTPVTQQRGAVMPRARSAELVVTELEGEQLVYDLRTHKMHHLNRLSMIVWLACDGTSTSSQVLDKMRSFDRLASDEVLWLALDQLERAQLLEGAYYHVASGQGLSRRTLLKRGIVAGAVTLPVISSLLAPSAAAAGSSGCSSNGKPCVCTGGYCTTNGDCCSNNCLSGKCTCNNNGDVNKVCASDSDCCSGYCKTNPGTGLKFCTEQ
jgi:hypothetical protein